MYKRSPYSYYLVCSYRRTYPAPADGYPPFNLPTGNCLCHRYDKIWIIIAGVKGVGAEVNDVEPGLPQLSCQLFLYSKSAVVCGDADAHPLTHSHLSNVATRLNIFSTVKPYSLIIVSPGADAPNRS